MNKLTINTKIHVLFLKNLNKSHKLKGLLKLTRKFIHFPDLINF
jgi:hypothetical protein